jgi:hypothetical protein
MRRSCISAHPLQHFYALALEAFVANKLALRERGQRDLTAMYQ